MRSMQEAVQRFRRIGNWLFLLQPLVSRRLCQALPGGCHPGLVPNQTFDAFLMSVWLTKIRAHLSQPKLSYLLCIMTFMKNYPLILLILFLNELNTLLPVCIILSTNRERHESAPYLRSKKNKRT